MDRAPSPLTRIVCGLIRGYQILIAPHLGDCCRFTPSCSHYAQQALMQHGFWKGSALTVWRLLRCQPFCRGGYDPVPARGRWRNPPETAVHAEHVPDERTLPPHERH